MKIKQISIDPFTLIVFPSLTDKATELESWRNDALSFPDVLEFKIQYIMKRLNCEHEEAVKYLSTTTQDDNTDLED